MTTLNPITQQSYTHAVDFLASLPGDWWNSMPESEFAYRLAQAFQNAMMPIETERDYYKELAEEK